jgi:hypothetical protein
MLCLQGSRIRCSRKVQALPSPEIHNAVSAFPVRKLLGKELLGGRHCVESAGAV